MSTEDAPEIAEICQQDESPGRGGQWSDEKRNEAAELICRGFSAEEASRRTGIPGSTIRYWKRNENEFKHMVARMRAELIEQSTAGVAALGRKAVVTVNKALDGDVTPVQLAAARMVLQHAFEERSRAEGLEAAAEYDLVADWDGGRL